MLRWLPPFVLAFFLSLAVTSTAFSQQPLIIDANHYSNVMGEVRNYRVFLPQDYYDQPTKRYPVVYFYHGWSQRYFGSITAKAEHDTGLNDEEKIAQMVLKYGLIVVKPDGYNKRLGDPYYLRPYNIGPVEGHRQFPLYFPELVEHIDALYRTHADRSQRGITGYSMGGFMSFWIAGKYPHLLSAAGSFCGSAEFFVGPLDFPVEYFHGDMYRNYEGLKLRLHYGEEDFIRAYHRDIDRIWKQVMDNYESFVFPGPHDLSGLEEMFQFFVGAFKDPAQIPARWNHIDVYPEFTVWDYRVSSDRSFPGYTVLEDVDKNGFGISVRSKLPDGETFPTTKLSVTTAALYDKNEAYEVTVLDLDAGESFRKTIHADDKGRLVIQLNGGTQEVGIHKAGGSPNLSLAAVKVLVQDYASTRTKTAIALELVNKGGSKAEGVSATLVAGSSAEVEEKSVKVGHIDVLEKVSISPLTFTVLSDSISTQKFTLQLTDQEGREWREHFVIDLKPKGKTIADFEIADGKTVTFQKGGKDTVTSVLGIGNGDGIPNPGESIVVLVKDGGLNRLTALRSLNAMVDLKSSHTRISDSWTQFDHVGGSFKYSMPVISSETPPGSELTLYASYWIPDYPDHHIRGGELTLTVQGEDQTAPQLDWAYVKAGNIFQAKLYDGGGIVQAEVRFSLEENPEKQFVFPLNGLGKKGDNAMNGVFSQKIQVPEFGLYKAEVTVVDQNGNKGVHVVPGTFILHEVDLYPAVSLENDSKNGNVF